MLNYCKIMIYIYVVLEIKSSELKEWSEAKIIFEKASKGKERFSDSTLKVSS